MPFVNILELNPRKTIVEFEYPALVEKGLERFIRTGTLYGKGAVTVITEEPFWVEAIYEFFKQSEQNRYVKHAGFPVVVMKDSGPAVQVPLYTSPSGIGDYLTHVRNVWAQKEVPKIEPGVAAEEKIKEMKNELLQQFFKLKAFKKAIDEAMKDIDAATKRLEPAALEKMEEVLPLEEEIEITKDFLKELLEEIVSVLDKYEKVLVKSFKRTMTRGGKPIIDFEKAFNLLADRFKLTEQKRKEFIEQATTIPEKIEKVQTVTQTKLIKRKSILKFAQGFFKQLWEKIKSFFKKFQDTTKEALESVSSLNEAIEGLLEFG